MEKRTLTNLVHMPGCEGCARIECKYNLVPNATAEAASYFDRSQPYGCNSKLFGAEASERE